MKTKIKSLLGNILIKLFPKKADTLVKTGMTIPIGQNFNWRDRLIRFAIMDYAEKNESKTSLAEIHHNFWAKKGAEFFSRTNDQFENDFLVNCAFVFDILEKELLKMEGHYNTLVEIGAGNGMTLEYLESKFPQIDRFFGIDLSKDQIRINNDKFQDNPRLEFVASDGFDWVNINGRGHMIFVTSRGVLEYFDEQRLKAFFDKIRSLGEVLFVAIEPNGVEHDFTKNPNSQVYGWEHSFSHNYSKLFKDSGFDIVYHSRKSLPHWGGIMNFIISKSSV